MDIVDTNSDTFHRSALDMLCRICGNIARVGNPKRQHVLCVNYVADIKLLYKIDINHDNKDLHPSIMCQSCYRVILNTRRVQNGYVVAELHDSQRLCRLHAPNCTLCDHYSDLQRLVFIRKTSVTYRTVILLFDPQSKNIFSEFGIPCCDSTNVAHSCSISHLSATQCSTFQCQICTHIFNTAAVKTKCEHYFCAFCLSNTFTTEKKNDVDCPTCDENVNYNEVVSVDDRFRIQVLGLMVKCEQCNVSFHMEGAHRHKCVIAGQHGVIRETPKQCEYEVTKTPIVNKSNKKTPESCKTLRSCLSRSLHSPLSKAEERVHTHLIRRKLKYSGAESTIHCKTGGQVGLTFITI